jgi:hypothetical protein
MTFQNNDFSSWKTHFSVNVIYKVQMHILLFSELDWFSGNEIEVVEVAIILQVIL